MKNNIVLVRNLGLQDWLKIFYDMSHFTHYRNFNTHDEIWFVEHYPIFTQGYIKKKENIVISNNIPIVTTNRGGQITYHGPGQQILYFLMDLKRRNISIRQLINVMQIIVIETLKNFFIQSHIKKNAPGVYIHDKKVCSLGLRVQKGCTLHGLSINVNMDLKPFSYIHPCGDKDIKMTQIKEFYQNIQFKELQVLLIRKISKYLQCKIIYCTSHCV